MKNKTFVYECNCIHCQQKLNQINNAKLYWEKFISKKSLYSFSPKFSKVLKLYDIKVVFKNLLFLEKKYAMRFLDLNY